MRSPRLLLPFLALLLAACAGTRSASPVNQAPAMQIVDPGQIYSTYDLRNDTQARNEVRSQGVTDAGWEEIAQLASESRWPAGLQDLTSRNANRDAIRRLRAFRIAAFDDKVILLVPADQGNGVPASLQGRKFYMVIGQGGVTFTD